MDYSYIWDILNKQSDISETTESEIKSYICDCIDDATLFEDSEYIICSKCGVVLDTIINDNKETNYCNENGEKSKDLERTGNSIDPLLPNVSMNNTVINTNGNGVLLSKTSKYLNSKNIPYIEKVIMKHKSNLAHLTSEHNIPGNVINDTLYRIKDLFGKNKKIYRGRIYNGLICVCFYYACKDVNYNIQINTLISMFSIDIKTFNKCCKIYFDQTKDVNNIVNESTDIIRVCGNLNLNSKLLKTAKDILKAGEDLHYISSVSPQGRIAGIIYFLELKLTLGIDIAFIEKITLISKATLNKVAKILMKNEIEMYNYIKFYLRK